MKVYHRTVRFKGHVQGVGFRYQTLQVAKGFDVSGWVRNEADGTVLLEVEGEANEVNSFVEEVVYEMRSYIKSFDESFEWREDQFRGFVIR